MGLAHGIRPTAVNNNTGIFTLQGVQSVIRDPPSARQCCNQPQSAISHTKNAKSPQAFKPELRGPNKGLEIGPPSSRGVRSAPLFAQIPNLPTKAGLKGV
eukprot:4495995-Alexandrium_andersonii.AAC.1